MFSVCVRVWLMPRVQKKPPTRLYQSCIHIDEMPIESELYPRT